MHKPTLDQQAFIDNHSRNIIVSAGAGSGKTATLTNRVIKLIEDGCSIRNMLILTFTVAAANSMKDKIRKEISKRSDEVKFKDELGYVDSAMIGTFDSFTNSLVNQYYYKLGFNEPIKVSDNNILVLVEDEMIKEVMEKHYEKPDASFDELINSNCTKNDNEVIDIIKSIKHSFDKLVNKYEVLDTYDAKYGDIASSKLIKEDYVKMLRYKISVALTKLKYFIGFNIDEANEDKTQKNGKVVKGALTIYDSIRELESDKTSDYVKFYSVIKSFFSNKDNYSVPTGNDHFNENPDEELKDRLGKARDKYLKACVAIQKLTKYDDLDGLKEEAKNKDNLANTILSLVKEIIVKEDEYKKDHKLYSFNDIALFAISLLKDNDSIRKELQERYKEIMIDEYQDTSDIQEELVNLISNNNVAVVGDIKQSIYRFRDAKPELFNSKLTSFTDYKKVSDKTSPIRIDLKENFRSREEVVNAVNCVFEKCMLKEAGGVDYIPNHKMVYGKKDYSEFNVADYNLEVFNYDSIYEHYRENYGLNQFEIEAFLIAKDIKDKCDKKYRVYDEAIDRPVEYKDFTILVQDAKNFGTFKKIFNHFQIPLDIIEKDDLLESDELLTFRSILKLVNLIYKNEVKDNKNMLAYYYMSIARSYLFKSSYKDDLIFDIITKDEIENDTIYIKALEISNQIDLLSIEEIIDKVLTDFNFINMYDSKDKINKILCECEYFVNNAKALGESKYSLEDYINYLCDVIENELKIENEQSDEASNACKILTIHKSKGLEYNVVYLAGLNKKFNTKDREAKSFFTDKLGLVCRYFDNGLKNTFLKELNAFYITREDVSEKIRLLYVAMTRAMQKLIILDRVKEDELKDFENPYEILQSKSFANILFGTYQNVLESYPNIFKHFKKDEIGKDEISYEKEITIDFKPRNDGKIEVNELDIKSKFNAVVQSSFSKKPSHLFTKEEKENMMFGEYMHYALEALNFKSLNIEDDIDSLKLDSKYSNALKRFFNNDILSNIKNAKVYKEYQFFEEDDEDLIRSEKTGIVDLMLEYDDHIDIIDYKLKHIDDEAYINQLNGYKNSIEHKTGKNVDIYLYSILGNELRKLN